VPPLPAARLSPTELSLRLRQQELVTEFGLFAMQGHGLQSILDEAGMVAAQGLEARFAKVLEYIPADRVFLVRAGVGWHPGVVGEATVGADLESPAGYAFRSSKPVISNHLAQETRFRTPTLLADHGIRSAINVIIRAGGGEPFGILEGDSTDRSDFTDQDVTFLQALANTLGAALEMQRRQTARDDLLREKDALLRDKDLLMQEVHHRVKNSLQLVRTMLQLQARALDNTEARAPLEQASARILTIAAVHRRLYEGGSVSEADAASYLRGLLDDMMAMMPDTLEGRAVEMRIAPVLLKADQITPLGLITTELVTNALKYGRGRIVVSTAVVPGGIEIAVADEGAGFPAGFDPAHGPGLGMRLIAALARSEEDSIRVDHSVPFGRIVVKLALDGFDAG